MTKPHDKNIQPLKQGGVEYRLTGVNDIPSTGMTRCALSRKDLLPHLILLKAANGPPSIGQLAAEISQDRHCTETKGSPQAELC